MLMLSKIIWLYVSLKFLLIDVSQNLSSTFSFSGVATQKNDTEHNSKIPKDSLIKIFPFLAFLLELMQTEKETDHYKNLVQKLPEDFRDEYHRLLQCGFYFIIGMHFAKRGREGKIFMPGSSHILVTSFLVFHHLGWVIFCIITQPKQWKTKNEVTKMCDEPDNVKSFVNCSYHRQYYENCKKKSNFLSFDQF